RQSSCPGGFDMPAIAIPSKVLTPDAIQSYHRQGYLIVPRVFDGSQIRDALAEADLLFERQDLIKSENIRCRWQPHVVTNDCLFECFDPVIDIAPVCERLARDERLLSIIGELYGEEACLFKDKLIFKPPGAKGYDLHQDFIAWANFPRSF